MLTSQIHFESKDNRHCIAKLEKSDIGWRLRFYFIRPGKYEFLEIDTDPVISKDIYIDEEEAIKDLKLLDYEETWRGKC